MHASPTHQGYYGWSSTTASVNVSCAHAVRMPKGRNGEENEQAYFSADGLDRERGNLVSRRKETYIHAHSYAIPSYMYMYE